MGMLKKNPNHLNKYKGTATEQDYKHNLNDSYTAGPNTAARKKTKTIAFIYIFKL